MTVRLGKLGRVVRGPHLEIYDAHAFAVRDHNPPRWWDYFVGPAVFLLLVACGAAFLLCMRVLFVGPL